MLARPELLAPRWRRWKLACALLLLDASAALQHLRRIFTYDHNPGAAFSTTGRTYRKWGGAMEDVTFDFERTLEPAYHPGASQVSSNTDGDSFQNAPDGRARLGLSAAGCGFSSLRQG